MKRKVTPTSPALGPAAVPNCVRDERGRFQPTRCNELVKPVRRKPKPPT